MADERKFSRPRHRAKLARREDIEDSLRIAILQGLEANDPTIVPGALRVISSLTAMVASQLASQTQSIQRALLTIEDDVPDFATEFVAQLCVEAKKDISKRIKRISAAPASSPNLQLADDWAGPVAGPTFIERQFGIPRSTLYRWQKRDEIVALNTRTSRKPVFPLRQFVDGRPADGISELISVFADHRSVWKWVVAPNSAFNGGAPLDALLDGDIKSVIQAAHVASRNDPQAPP